MKGMNWALGLCLAGAALATPAQAKRDTARYTSLTVFGDSLVDAGNVFIAFGGTQNPASRGYFQGRFTNGFDYTDLLSLDLFGRATTASLAGGTNFAWGGARATTTSPFVLDLNEQLANYDVRRAGGLAVDKDGLYVLNFGGNDIFAAASTPGAPTGYASDEAFLREAAGNLASAVQRLDDLGVRNVLLTGFPVATVGPARDFSFQAQGYLTEALAGLTLGADTSLFRFSYLDFFDRLLVRPQDFGFPNGLILPPATCQAANAFPACPDFFLFDNVHPTAAVQRAIYDDLNRQFDLAGAVPEPATWGMMIVGVGAVGGALRSRRRGRAVAA